MNEPTNGNAAAEDAAVQEILEETGCSEPPPAAGVAVPASSHIAFGIYEKRGEWTASQIAMLQRLPDGDYKLFGYACGVQGTDGGQKNG